MLLGTRRAEIVAAAADGDHQRVVGERALRRDQPALVVVAGGQQHALAGSIEADHLADAVAEMVPMRLGEIVQRVVVQVQAACGDLVQQRLPEMGARPLDQRHLGLAAPAQPVAEPGHQLQAAGTAADHDDAVRRNALIRSWTCDRLYVGPAARRGLCGLRSVKTMFGRGWHGC